MANDAGEGNRDLILREVVRQSLRDGSRRFVPGKVPCRLGRDARSVVSGRGRSRSQPTPSPSAASNRTGRRSRRSGSSIRPIWANVVKRVTAYIQRHLPGSTNRPSQHVSGKPPLAWRHANGRLARGRCVDRTLRYHDLQNLYVLSTSTFPSSSSANPTLTLAALALRLGDHLKPASAGRPG
jgi:hypothetical protein